MLSSSKKNAIAVSYITNNSITAQTKELRNFLLFQLGRREQIASNAMSGGLTSPNSGLGERALIEAEIVAEIITVPESEILPVPQMPYCVMGIYSWRSEMLWIVDLENLLGYPPSLTEKKAELESESSKLLVMIVQLQGQTLGLVISNVSHIIQKDIKELNTSSSELFAEDLQPFLQGYFNDENNEIAMLIEAKEIFGFFSVAPSFVVK
jgi:positive phototaxis protein PixI